MRIEDYALIGDTHTGALVGRDGSIDWWCVPRFDSGACFAALLGDRDNGRWRIGPAGAGTCTRRSYAGATLVLETTWETAGGCVRVTDFMPLADGSPSIVRLVDGVAGAVEMEMDLVVRFDYGRVVPWVRRHDGGALTAIGGPDMLALRTPVEVHGKDLSSEARWTVREGDRVPFVLSWGPSNAPPLDAADASGALDATRAWWEQWSARRHTIDGPAAWDAAIARSLVTLKALTYAPTGGIIAAPTTSLPEALGGVRNWDYRYCWLRDSTLALYALLLAGYRDEAVAWRDWLLRAVAGTPQQLQIMYGPAGERRMSEWEAPWLDGYEASRPVRIGNAAAGQFQLDVFGEVMDTLSSGRRLGLEEDDDAWRLQQALMDELETVWQEPDDGIWEMRGPRRHYVHSKVMAWVALDRAVHAVEHGRPGPLDRWRRTAGQIHDEVCKLGFNAEVGAFTQYYGSAEMDAALLMIPLVGFLPPGDERVAATVRAIERELMHEGFVMRYHAQEDVDGLPAGEGAFIPCSLWLADVWAISGRSDDARAMFERVLDLRNDVGLLAEEWDTERHRQVGNFPQAFSHLAIVNTGHNLSPGRPGAAHHRSHLRDGG